jgi:hypothetical protein
MFAVQACLIQKLRVRATRGYATPVTRGTLPGPLWHLARPPAVAALACFFKEQEAGGS